MTFFAGLGEKIALSLTLDLIKSTAGAVRRRLSKGETEKALQAAVATGLDEALASLDLDPLHRNEYESLFEQLFRREAVVDELALLLDPRPGVELNFQVLTEEFNSAGFDPDLIPHFRLDEFLRTFASAFYAAAAGDKALQGSLEMKLLGEVVNRMGSVARDSQRTAEATEQMARMLPQFMENQIAAIALLQAGQEARDKGFLAAIQAYEGIRSALLKAGFDLGIDKNDAIEILGSDRKALPPAQEQTIRTLAGDLRQTMAERTPEPAELDTLEERYRQHVIRWFENLQFQGLMRTPRPILLALEDVYVELRAVAEVPEAADAFSVEERRLLLEAEGKDEGFRHELMKQLDSLRRERWSRTLPERKSMAEALHQRDRRAFVILGDPGSGKTTLLHFLALVYARGPATAAERLKADAQEADRLPIFVPLAAFDDMLRETPGLTLLDFLPRYYDRRRGLPGLAPLFRRALDSGRALILLDGLDEVLDTSTRNYVAQQAGALISDLTPRGVRFAVSSRFVGYREAPVPGNQPSLSVLDFGEPEIDLFVHRWAYAYEKWAAEGKETPEMLANARTLEADLLADVKSNESVRRLAANPLMLTMLALLRRQVGKLPHRRVQLYESYVGALLETWIGMRTPGAHEASAKTFDRFRAENLLLPLSLWLQQEKPSGTASGFEIRTQLTDLCLAESSLTRENVDIKRLREAEKQAEEFLREMRQLTGLLIERGHDAFGFLHLTFQEYFAGRALASLSDEERWRVVRPHLHDPRWREPILLCAGRLGVVENRRPQVTNFVRAILDRNDPTEEKLHRNLLLALAIAGDDVNLDPALIQEMVGRAVACLPTQIRTLAQGLVAGLGQLVANGAAGAEECFGKVLVSEDWRHRKWVVEALARFAGIEGIQRMLLERLRDEDVNVQAAVLAAVSSQVGVAAVVRAAVLGKLEDRNELVRQSAIGALSGWVGSDESVRAAVLGKLEDQNFQVRYSAFGALSGLVGSDESVRAAVLGKLEDQNYQVFMAAIDALSGLVGSDESVRAAVLGKLEDQSDFVRHSAINALSGLVGSDESVRAAVLGQLEDQDEYVRQSAIGVLSGLVGSDESVRAAVLGKLNDPNTNVRQAVIMALAVAVGVHRDVRRALLARLEQTDESEEKRALLRSLSGLLADGEVASVFEKQVASEEWTVRQSLAEILGENAATPESRRSLRQLLESRKASASWALLGAVTVARPRSLAANKRWRRWWLDKMASEQAVERSQALSALRDETAGDSEIRRAALEGLGDKDDDVRGSALRALSGVVGTDAEVRSAILERLGDEVSWVRISALSALSGAVGTDAEVRSAVLERLGDEDSNVCQSALRALSGVVGTDAEIRSTVLKQLGDEQSEVRQSALRALAGVVGTDAEVRSAVLERLGDGWSDVRQSALRALSGVVGTDAEIRSTVLKQLGDEQSEVRQSALRALAGVVGTDAEVRCAVLERLGDEVSWVRISALSALSGAVGTDAEVRSAVLERLGDEVGSVRSSAVRALASLFGRSPEITQAVVEKLEDSSFEVRLAAVEVIAKGPSEALDQALLDRLQPWLSVDVSRYSYSTKEGQKVQALLAGLLGPRIPADPAFRDELLAMLEAPRWSTRAGAILTLLQWPAGPPDDVLDRIFGALDDRRGLEAYPAQLTAASFLINQNDSARASIEICLEALDYGLQTWEGLDQSYEIRQQAALVLGKLEPLGYEERIYGKLVQVMEKDPDFDVKDAAYGTLVRLARIRDGGGAG